MEPIKFKKSRPCQDIYDSMHYNDIKQKTVESINESFLEEAAALEHERWARWQKYLHSKLVLPSQDNGWAWLPKKMYQRWERQIKTPYSELSEEEKESDRKEVRKYFPLIQKNYQQLVEEALNMGTTFNNPDGSFNKEAWERNQVIAEIRQALRDRGLIK